MHVNIGYIKMLHSVNIQYFIISSIVYINYMIYQFCLDDKIELILFCQITINKVYNHNK